MSDFDLAIIGGGPGGYVAAIKAAQLGMKVVCVEKRGALGGTCLNIGCIPSKALLNSSEKYESAQHEFADHGINCQVKLDLAKMLLHKDKIVADLNKGIEMLFAKNKVTYLKGAGSVVAPGKVSVRNGTKEEFIESKNIILATGSEVVSLPNIKIDEEKIVSSTGALSLKQVPKRMIVIGGGYIGLEMGSIWRRLGAEVTVVEYADRLVPAMDIEVAKQLQKLLEKQGMKFKLGTKVLGVESGSKTSLVDVEILANSKQEKLEAEIILVAVGRKPHTEGLGLEKIGIILDKMGRVVINDKFQTNVPGIYAIGDIVAGPMLAHKAEEEGIACVENIAGQHGHVNYNLIPGVIYTSPEVAYVGKTEEEVKAMNIPYKVGKFPFLANSRAKAVSDTDGFVKMIARADNDEILGVHIIGQDAGTIIAEAVIAMEFKASSEDIARICHAHPTLNEAVKEAALATFAKAIHM